MSRCDDEGNTVLAVVLWCTTLLVVLGAEGLEPAVADERVHRCAALGVDRGSEEEAEEKSPSQGDGSSLPAYVASFPATVNAPIQRVRKLVRSIPTRSPKPAPPRRLTGSWSRQRP